MFQCTKFQQSYYMLTRLTNSIKEHDKAFKVRQMIHLRHNVQNS